jgi:hypothetical protein
MKKNAWKWGILGLALVFALVLAGCGNPIPEKTINTVAGVYSFRNTSSYDVSIRVTKGADNAKVSLSTSAISSPKSFTLKKGESAAFTGGASSITYSGSATGEVKDSSLLGIVTFTDK